MRWVASPMKPNSQPTPTAPGPPVWGSRHKGRPERIIPGRRRPPLTAVVGTVRTPVAYRTTLGSRQRLLITASITPRITSGPACNSLIRRFVRCRSTDRTGWLGDAGIDTALIDPGKPWQNATDESFNGKFRDEFLSLQWFRNRMDAKVGIEQWRRLCQVNSPRGTMPGCTFDDPATFGIAFRLKSSATPSGCITDTA